MKKLKMFHEEWTEETGTDAIAYASTLKTPTDLLWIEETQLIVSLIQID